MPRSVIFTGALVVVASVAVALPARAAERVVLSQGHVDVLDIAFEEGELEVLVHDETGERDPDDVLFHVKPEAETTVPDGPAFAFLGDAGDPVWILPQDNNPELLFAGLAAEEVEPGVFTDDTLRIKLVHVRGPADVSMFTVNEFGQPTRLTDSGDGLPDATTIHAGVHQHLNWAFEAEGDYVLTFVVTGRLAAGNDRVSSGPVNIRFHVGALGNVLPASAAVTLDDGHVDGAFVKYANPNLRLWIGDHTGGGTVERDPADVILRARPESEKTVPASPNPACLGTPGNPVWILPQVEDPALLWLGWSAESIGSGVVDGNQVTLRLKSVTPPGGTGVLCVYSRSGFTTTKIFDSSDGLPDSVAIPVGATGHRHVNWAFTAGGTWTVVFEATATVGGIAKSTGDKTYTFSID